MKRLRRLWNVVRGRRLLAAGAFVFLGYLFANNLSPESRHVAQTGAKVAPLDTSRGQERWPTVGHVSDDGREVVVCIHVGNAAGWDGRLELWDVRAGVDRTPAHWNEPAWQVLLAGSFRDDGTGLTTLVADPAGREFLRDGAAWAVLRGRLAGPAAGPGASTRFPT